MKNATLNVVKAVAAMLVICIHCKFPGKIGENIVDIARIAVPIFLLISGFYSYNNTQEKVCKKIKHILKLMIVANLVYLVWQIIILPNTVSIQTYFTSILNWKTILKIIIFNDNPFRTHLWFFNALFYCYITCFIYKKMIKNDKLYKNHLACVIMLLVTYVIISITYMTNENQDMMYIIRNFIFVGIPFFYIGNYINRYKIMNKVTNKTIGIIILLSICCILCEAKFYDSELYIGNIFLAISIFIFSVKNPYMLKSELLEKIGDKYSLYIYIFHPALKDILNYIYKMFNINNIFMLYAQPILLIIISIIFSVFIDKVIKIIKKEKMKNEKKFCS